ncbi:NAD(P)/FAD-dependent oxidoreductase [Azospirillum rugosum]|uniref:Glycine/D-amino acid oxidase-like deaminating enzyme n=1 Tax=Azospirillum rugosum TaxID=416170 RepID=A0ABS4SEG7_9PROT|nr:FAD-dependent oxidoreductase [Azospirillum rugosum]MBP2290968.1 glycine/D-amino acid oxidase-like deaminating enzyme [Azospirillum rugosum]MDQ0524968.1 glycine/D-amino acid oxidase-like deaminating enzyme [Azospirillum rugosum]
MTAATIDTALPPSLWAKTAPPALDLPTLSGEVEADVVIVGGGFTGLSTALHLAEAGASAVVLEAAEPGWGASGRNNGQVIPTLTRADPDDLVALWGPQKGEQFVRVLRDSADLLFGIVAKHGIDCEAVQNGWVQPAHRKSRLAISAKRAEQWGRRGAPVELLDRDRCEAITGSPYWYGGWQNRSGGRINPLALARGMARAAVSAGAKVYKGTPATGLTQAGDRWRVTTPRGSVVAKRVVLATNAYSDGLWPKLAQTIVPIRSYQMATQPLSENLRRSILPDGHALSDTQGDLYFFRQDAQGRLVTGGALVFDVDSERRLRARISERLQRVFPQIGPVTFDHVWWGYIGMTPERLPRLHELAPGVVTWIGCQGRAVALGTAMGKELAQYGLGRPADELPIPLSPLRPLPFHVAVRTLARGMLLLYRWRDIND